MTLSEILAYDWPMDTDPNYSSKWASVPSKQKRELVAYLLLLGAKRKSKAGEIYLTADSGNAGVLLYTQFSTDDKYLVNIHSIKEWLRELGVNYDTE